MKALPSPCRMKGSIATFLGIRMLLCHSVANNAPPEQPSASLAEVHQDLPASAIRSRATRGHRMARAETGRAGGPAP
jgi:hypothetical protein